MNKVDVDRNIKVNLNGQAVNAKVRRIGPGYRGWHMATLDIGGEVAYVAVHESELAPFPKLARAA